MLERGDGRAMGGRWIWGAEGSSACLEGKTRQGLVEAEAEAEAEAGAGAGAGAAHGGWGCSAFYLLAATVTM